LKYRELKMDSEELQTLLEKRDRSEVETAETST